VRVLGDLPDQRLAVRLRHPVARLDALICGDERVELFLLRLVHPTSVTCKPRSTQYV
jgi:hypothetical protein